MSAWHVARRGSRHYVEHIPSGCEIAQFASRKVASDFIAAIAPFADWHRPTPAHDIRVLEQVRRAAARERA